MAKKDEGAKPKAGEGEPIIGTFTLLPEGDAKLEVPANLSAESIADLDAHLKIFLDGLKREAEAPPEGSE